MVPLKHLLVAYAICLLQFEYGLASPLKHPPTWLVEATSAESPEILPLSSSIPTLSSKTEKTSQTERLSIGKVVQTTSEAAALLMSSSSSSSFSSSTITTTMPLSSTTQEPSQAVTTSTSIALRSSAIPPLEAQSLSTVVPRQTTTAQDAHAERSSTASTSRSTGFSIPQIESISITAAPQSATVESITSEPSRSRTRVGKILPEHGLVAVTSADGAEVTSVSASVSSEQESSTRPAEQITHSILDESHTLDVLTRPAASTTTSSLTTVALLPFNALPVSTTPGDPRLLFHASPSIESFSPKFANQQTTTTAQYTTADLSTMQKPLTTESSGIEQVLPQSIMTTSTAVSSPKGQTTTLGAAQAVVLSQKVRIESSLVGGSEAKASVIEPKTSSTGSVAVVESVTAIVSDISKSDAPGSSAAAIGLSTTAPSPVSSVPTAGGSTSASKLENVAVVNGQTLQLGSTVLLGSGTLTTKVVYNTDSIGRPELVQGSSTFMLSSSSTGIGGYILYGIGSEATSSASSTSAPASVATSARSMSTTSSGATVLATTTTLVAASIPTGGTTSRSIVKAVHLSTIASLFVLLGSMMS